MSWTILDLGKSYFCFKTELSENFRESLLIRLEPINSTGALLWVKTNSREPLEYFIQDAPLPSFGVCFDRCNFTL